MTNPIPADAVREALDYLMLFGPNKSARDTIEAHIAALTARVSYLESAWQVETLARKDAVIAAQECDNDELKARLAALAGAADGRRPIAWVVATKNHGPCISLSDEFLKVFPNAPCDFIPHAPAKAREVTDADVERAIYAFNIFPCPVDGSVARCYGDSSKAQMRAALATFAEGE